MVMNEIQDRTKTNIDLDRNMKFVVFYRIVEQCACHLRTHDLVRKGLEARNVIRNNVMTNALLLKNEKKKPPQSLLSAREEREQSTAHATDVWQNEKNP